MVNGKKIIIVISNYHLTLARSYITIIVIMSLAFCQVTHSLLCSKYFYLENPCNNRCTLRDIYRLHVYVQAGADLGFLAGGDTNPPWSGEGQHTILQNFPKNCMKLRTFFVIVIWLMQNCVSKVYINIYQLQTEFTYIPSINSLLIVSKKLCLINKKLKLEHPYWHTLTKIVRQGEKYMIYLFVF